MPLTSRWAALAIILVIFIFIAFKNNVIEIREDPEILVMKNEVLISKGNFIDPRASALKMKHGCKFWNYQLSALVRNLEITDLLISIDMQAKDQSEIFISNYATYKSELHSKHDTSSKPGEHPFFKDIRKLEARSPEYDLEKHKETMKYLPLLIKKRQETKANLKADKEFVNNMISRCTAHESDTLKNK